LYIFQEKLDKLISLREILMVDSDSLDTHGEFIFGPFANLLYLLGRLDNTGPTTQEQAIQIGTMCCICIDWMEKFGFRVSAKNTRYIRDIIDGREPYSGLHDHITALRQSLMTELETKVFVQIDFVDARHFREPCRDWEEVILRFGNTVSNIEEASKCYALKRYAATVFHCMQIFEQGILVLGKFMQINDPKSGFTAVYNELQRIKNTKYGDLTDFEKNHFAFYEQIYASIQAAKDAWRNKISHPQGRFILMTTDFTPAIAQEIYMATRGFMRRLATDLP
jgi:hypothetical protein